MKKGIFTLAILFSGIYCHGQIPKEKVIINNSCATLPTSMPILDELKTSDKELTDYLKIKYAKNFFKSPIEINLVLTPKAQPCCRKTVIVDSTQITKAQIEILLKYVTDFPGFNNVAIEAPRRLRLFIAADKKNLPFCSFITESKTK